MIVVDSSVWIANLRNQDTAAVRSLRSSEDPANILVGDLVLLEGLQGARSDADAARIERHLRQFTVEPILDPALAVTAARNYRQLRQSGITVRKTIDITIGTFCIERDHVLLHDDRDFRPMEVALGLGIHRVDELR